MISGGIEVNWLAYIRLILKPKFGDDPLAKTSLIWQSCWCFGEKFKSVIKKTLTLLHKKMKISIKDFVSKCDQETANSVIFTDDILNEKPHFFCAVSFNAWFS